MNHPPTKRPIRVGIGLVGRDGRYLIRQRPAGTADGRLLGIPRRQVRARRVARRGHPPRVPRGDRPRASSSAALRRVITHRYPHALGRAVVITTAYHGRPARRARAGDRVPLGRRPKTCRRFASPRRTGRSSQRTGIADVGPSARTEADDARCHRAATRDAMTGPLPARPDRLVPLAAYLFVLALWHGGRHPRVVSGRVDFALLASGSAGWSPSGRSASSWRGCSSASPSGPGLAGPGLGDRAGGRCPGARRPRGGWWSTTSTPRSSTRRSQRRSTKARVTSSGRSHGFEDRARRRGVSRRDHSTLWHGRRSRRSGATRRVDPRRSSPGSGTGCDGSPRLRRESPGLLRPARA